MALVQMQTNQQKML